MSSIGGRLDDLEGGNREAERDRRPEHERRLAQAEILVRERQAMGRPITQVAAWSSPNEEVTVIVYDVAPIKHDLGDDIGTMRQRRVVTYAGAKMVSSGIVHTTWSK